MKTLNSVLFFCLSYFSLSAQTDSTNNDCINFDDWNMCYSVDYRPEDEKVGRICSINDLLINKSVEIVSFDIRIYDNSKVIVLNNKTLESSYIEIIFSLMKKLTKEDKITIVFDNIKLNVKGKTLAYPAIMLSKCN